MQPGKIHIIGIAGVGMSATAVLLKDAGWRVTGSDAESYGPTKGVLERAGIAFKTGYTPENIPADTDCFMVGRNAKLAPEENAEVAAAAASGKPRYSFPEMLARLTAGRENLVVAGSYGKSTTTSLAAHILRHTGLDAGYFVGAEPVASAWLPAPAALGTANEFVLEGDEYPSAHDDPRAKFLHLHPHDVLLTSVVHDHVNVYPTFESYEEPFRKLAALIPDDGLVVACADEAGALALAKDSGKRVITYGLRDSGAEYLATDIRYGERTRFTLVAGGTPLGEIETSLLGMHNVENIAGAAAWTLAREQAPFGAVARAIADFPGVRRRLDNLAPASRVPVLEGFGSSYEKARAAIEAVLLHFKGRRLVIVFEPHTFSWRNRASLRWYDDIFTGAAEVFVLPPATQGASTHEQLDHGEIMARIGETARPYEGPEATAAALKGDDVVLVLTSGDLEGTLGALVAAVATRFS
ncbi:MAG: hypothetical protein KGI78_04375 [Patescibacteria group bacterium]|nr:hypothetical protein [Patescibacteria group bacterium]MDE1945432.1 hypothetical protein [Patescibacteria group bacterium]MDE2058049.1 hypothetical protein [Patescibacteria group bacterium]